MYEKSSNKMENHIQPLSPIETNAFYVLASTLEEKANSRNNVVEQTYIPQKAYDRIVELEKIETPYGTFAYTNTRGNETQRILFISYDKKTGMAKTHTLQRMDISFSRTKLRSSKQKELSRQNLGTRCKD